MAVERFSDPDAAARALWTDRSDPRLVSKIRSVWSRPARLTPPLPRGIKRFRDIQDAQRDRDETAAIRAAQLRQQRTR